MWTKSLLAGLMLALSACMTTPAPTPQPNIYVMRHLHTPKGAPDPDLTAVGQDHAARLADWFRRDPPSVIYVSSTRRAQQTAAPLAARLGLTPKVYSPADTAGLVAAVTRETGTVLIVGHSNTVPDIVAQLGGTQPRALVHEDFGDIWNVRGTPRTTAHFTLGK